MNKIKSFFEETTKKNVAKDSTQICRDPNSNNFGCCDRNYWHYKITDFPSIILQQAIYSLSIFQEQITDKDLKDYISKIITAGGNFWEKEQSDTDLLKNITLTKMVTPHLHSQLFQWQSCVTIIKLKLRMYQEAF